CAHLHSHAVPVPNGVAVNQGQSLPKDFPYPAVIKRRDAAGALSMRIVDSADNLDRPIEFDARLESLCKGLPVSVALLCGPAGVQALPACKQNLASDGSFSYLGGELPLPAELVDRATALARRA